MTIPKPRFLGPDYAGQFQDESVAAVYRKRPPYPDETFDLIARLLPVKTGRLLDIGSGTGEMAIPLSQRVEFVDAVEPSLEMLNIARQTAGSERVKWHHLGAETFSYPTNYDLIICAQCLGWLDWDIVFPRFARALTTSGWLAIVSQQSFTEQPWLDELTGLIATFSTNQDFEPFDLIGGLVARGLFTRHGTSATEPVPLDQTIGDFIHSIHARNGFSRNRMSAEAAESFDRQVEELLIGYHADGVLRGNCSARVTWGRP